MNRNKDKCEVIAMNEDHITKFSDGTPLKHVSEATHLGGKLTKDTNPITEIQNRIAACIPIMKTLDTCWNKDKLQKQMEYLLFECRYPYEARIRIGDPTMYRKPTEKSRRLPNERIENHIRNTANAYGCIMDER